MASHPADDLIRQGREAWQRGDFATAVQLAQAALQHGGEGFDVHGLLGDSHLGLQQFEPALQAYEQALRFDPGNPSVTFLCGEMLFHLGRFDACVARLTGLDTGGDKALATEHAITLGRAQQIVGLPVQAEINLVTAFVNDPAHEGAAYNLAVFYEQQQMPQQALQILEPAVVTHPQSVRLRYNLGTVLTACGDTGRAITVLEDTLRLAPRHLHAHHNLAMACLRAGQLRQGWTHYAWRFNRHQSEGAPADWAPRTAPLPLDLQGTTVRVSGEQGIGDELFFMRYLPALQQRGARVTYQPCNAKLRPLLGQLQQQGLFNSWEDSGAPFGTNDSMHILIGDLPLALGEPHISSCPPAVRLTPDPLRVEALRARLPLLGGVRPRLGLAWRAGTQASPQGRFERERLLSKSMPLEPLLDILAPLDVDVVILQRRPEASELDRIHERLGSARCLDASHLDQDLGELLALLSCVDRLVGVSNTNVHLFAALGRTGDVLVPCPHEFRWQETGEGTPWFPGFGVYRQAAQADWQAPLARLAADLGRRYGGPGAGAPERASTFTA